MPQENWDHKDDQEGARADSDLKDRPALNTENAPGFWEHKDDNTMDAGEPGDLADGFGQYDLESDDFL